MRAARLVIAMLFALAGAGVVSPQAASAQTDADLPGTSIALDPVGAAGVSGLAILTPRDGGTAANVLAVGAPAGTTAVVHAGTCTAIDPTPVGLLGDIGATGQLSTVIPVAYSRVADGGHVIVFHAGLDLATVLGCGQIPLVTAPTDPAGPGATDAPAATFDPATRYESAAFGFGIGWVAPWAELPLEAIPGIDAVRLGNGTSEVIFAGDRVANGDAGTCLRDWEGRVLDTLREGTIDGLAPVTDADGKPVGGGDAQRSVGAYQFQLLAADAGGATIIERVDCRRLSSDSVLEITFDTPSDAFAAESVALEALLAGLSMSGTVATGSPAPVAPTQTPAPVPPTPEPTTMATAVPTPVPDTGCAGMDAWVPATLSRIDQLKGLADDAAAAINNGMDAYASRLAANSLSVQELLQAQLQGPAPVAARQVQEDLKRMYRLLADAYDLLAQAYRAADAALLPEGLGKANEAQALLTSVRRALREAAAPCGITVPSA